MNLRSLPLLDAAGVRSALTRRDVVDALEAALRGGLDPSAGIPRTVVDVAAGQLLLMSAQWQGFGGLKLATVAPANPGMGLPRIQGVYILLDAATLSPVAVLDGVALTTLRTSAVSALAVRHLATREPQRLLVLGTGPQAEAHVHALAAVVDVLDVVLVGRDPHRLGDLVNRLCGKGFVARRVLSADLRDGDVASASIVVCATTSVEPLFEGRAVAESALVVAVGSHEPSVRETDAALARRATVVVEDVATALREAGDVVQAVSEGALSDTDLVPLADVVSGRWPVDVARPRMFKSVGMAWEDVVVAAAVFQAAARAGAI